MQETSAESNGHFFCSIEMVIGKLQKYTILCPSFVEVLKLMILEKSEIGVSRKIDKTVNLSKASSDGPNENLLFLNHYLDRRWLNEPPALLDVGHMTCIRFMEL